MTLPPLAPVLDEAPTKHSGPSGAPDPTEELQRFARKLVRMRPLFELVFYFGSLLVGIASVAAAFIGWWAFREYEVQNRVAARAQLMTTEQALSQRELDDGLYAQLHVDLPAGTPPANYASGQLALLTADPELRNAPSAPALHELIWSTASWETKNRAELEKLRKLHRHAAAHVYLLQTAFDYRSDRIISQGEWETWAGMTRDVGRHPVLLAVLHAAHRHQYLSREFAADLRQRLLDSPSHRAVVERFYPEMLQPAWLQGFPSYSYQR